MAIRYDKKLNQEIARTVRNFNQKISRLQKQERNLILPQKVTTESLKSYNTRTDLKRKLKELKKFSTRGIEETITTDTGISLSKYELSNLKQESSRIKRNLTRQIKSYQQIKPRILGKEQDVTFAEMGDTEYLNLVTRRKAFEKDITKLEKREFERYKTLLEKTRHNQEYMNYVFKENYFEMLTSLGYYTKYDDKKLNELKGKLMNIPSNKFLKLFKEDKSIRAILDYYPVITNSFINTEDIEDDVKMLYDNLLDNIDEIIKDYA